MLFITTIAHLWYQDYILIIGVVLMNFIFRKFIYKKDIKFLLINSISDFLLYAVLATLLAITIMPFVWWNGEEINNIFLYKILSLPYGYILLTELLIFLVILIKKIFLYKDWALWKFYPLERVILFIGYHGTILLLKLLSFII